MEHTNKKRFGMLINALRKEDGGKQANFVENLFMTLGADTQGIDTRLKNWIAGRNEGYKEYFKRTEITPDHYNRFIMFLQKSINARFTNVQSSLKEHRNDYVLIDFDTMNQDIFFKSVLTQFKDIVGIPIGKQRSKPNTNLEPKPMSEVFTEYLQAFGVEEFITDDLAKSLGSHYFNDISEFNSKISYNVENASKNEGYTLKIIEFIDTLTDYVDFLRGSMRLVSTDVMDHHIRIISIGRMDSYLPPENDTEFYVMAKKYREQLRSQLDDIILLLSVIADSGQ